MLYPELQTADLTEAREAQSQEILEIYTLGRFVARKGEKELTSKSKQSAKLWELFKYLLTNRNKVIPAEQVVESLWPDQVYGDPNAALHTLIHRLRKLFYEDFNSGEEPFHIEVNQGRYCMVLNENCRLDVDEFSRCHQEGIKLNERSPGEAIKYYSRALSLYGGEYLPEYSSEKWVLPAKRHYRNLFLQVLLSKIGLLMDYGHYERVHTLCEEAFQVEQFMEVEALHLYFMEALYKSGNVQEALCHYDFLTSSLYHEFGARPSPAMRDLYRRIKSEIEPTKELDLNTIHEKLQESEESNRSFICDPDFFRLLYRLEKRRSEREKQDLVMGLFSISWDDYRNFEKRSLNQAMDYLKKILQDNLRKGDVVTRWSDSQYLVLLRGVRQPDSHKIFSRVNFKFNAVYKTNGISLEVSRKSGLD